MWVQQEAYAFSLSSSPSTASVLFMMFLCKQGKISTSKQTELHERQVGEHIASECESKCVLEVLKVFLSFDNFVKGLWL